MSAIHNLESFTDVKAPNIPLPCLSSAVPRLPCHSTLPKSQARVLRGLVLSCLRASIRLSNNAKRVQQTMAGDRLATSVSRKLRPTAYGELPTRQCHNTNSSKRTSTPEHRSGKDKTHHAARCFALLFRYLLRPRFGKLGEPSLLQFAPCILEFDSHMC